LLKEEKLAKPNDTLKDITFYRPKPTDNCSDGYHGRLGIYEVLPVTETIKEMIVQRASSDKITEQAKKEGMRTMVEDGFIKAAKGTTSIEEILRVINE
jgi:type II secretory ATPase GspE/PulE/Tfp pilus assembly ATPase PilB-like protein